MLSVGKPLEGMQLTEFSRVRAAPFVWRVLLYLGLVALFILIALRTRGIVPWLAVCGLGLIYAHGVELQHQALHNTAFPSRFFNRWVGFLLGLPMLVSVSDYQYSHLRHHRLLGTKDDREFFNYGYDRLTSLGPLLAHLLMLRHYRDVARFICGSVIGRVKPDIKREVALQIRTEYRLMAVFLLIMGGVTAAFATPLFLVVWLLPLLIAVPAHALIELPEHWGRDHGTLDVLANTRTIKASIFGSWFTNGNNFHIEHHWLPGVPNDRFPELHRMLPGTETETYPAFYLRFFQELYRNSFTRQPEVT
jgi:fatty acid desaturase